MTIDFSLVTYDPATKISSFIDLIIIMQTVSKKGSLVPFFGPFFLFLGLLLPRRATRFLLSLNNFNFEREALTDRVPSGEGGTHHTVPSVRVSVV